MNSPCWVYKRTQPDLYTVGFYEPGGQWVPDSDFNQQEQAARRAAWLNGSPGIGRMYPQIEADLRAALTHAQNCPEGPARRCLELLIDAIRQLIGK